MAFTDVRLVISDGVPLPLDSLANGANVLPVSDHADGATQGLVAEGATISSQPVTIGGRVCTSLATRTLHADGEAQQAAVAADGRSINLPFSDPGSVVATVPVPLTTTGDVELVAAGASGVKLACVGLLIDNVSATDTSLILKDGATVRGRISVPKRGGGVPPIALPLAIIGTAATALNGALSDAATTVYVTPLVYRTQV